MSCLLSLLFVRFFTKVSTYVTNGSIKLIFPALAANLSTNCTKRLLIQKSTIHWRKLLTENVLLNYNIALKIFAKHAIITLYIFCGFLHLNDFFNIFESNGGVKRNLVQKSCCKEFGNTILRSKKVLNVHIAIFHVDVHVEELIKCCSRNTHTIKRSKIQITS